MNPNDIVLIGLIAMFVPLLVHVTLKGPAFSPRIQAMIVLGAWIWLLYAVFHEVISGSLFGIWFTDEFRHNLIAHRLAAQMSQGRWGEVWAHVGIGNEMWQMYLALLYHFTGVSGNGSTCINMLFAFWGGLILVREMVRVLPSSSPRSSWPLLIVFFPSVVYWCTWNLKEGFMYWAICLVFTGVRAQALTIGDFSRVSVGLLVGGLLRPHIIMGWGLAVLGVNLIEKERRLLVLLVLVVSPLLIVALTQLTHVESPASKALLDRAYQHANRISLDEKGSDIDFGSTGPILFVSGFESLFFRPYPWRIRHLGLLISVFETWTMTLFIMWVWWRMPMNAILFFLRMPHIRLAIFACIFFSLFFTFLTNEGLMVRQRVQAVPALITLGFIPYLYRRAIMNLKKMEWMLRAKALLDEDAPRTRGKREHAVGRGRFVRS